MKYCSKCCNSMEDDAAFCPSCGQSARAAKGGGHVAPEEMGSAQMSRALNLSRKTWVLFLFGLVVLAGAFSLVHLLSCKDKYQVETNSEQISFEIRRKPNASMWEGYEKTIQQGRSGTLERYTYFRERYIDGELRLRERIPAGIKKESVIVARPLTQIVEYGTKQPSITDPASGVQVTKTGERTWIVIFSTARLWVPTGIEVRAGYRVSISVSGEFMNGPYGSVGPQGVGGDPMSGKWPIPGVRMLSTAARVGPSGDAIDVGVGATLSSTRSGELYLGTADDILADNQGSRTARITVE